MPPYAAVGDYTALSDTPCFMGLKEKRRNDRDRTKGKEGGNGRGREWENKGKEGGGDDPY